MGLLAILKPLGAIALAAGTAVIGYKTLGRGISGAIEGLIDFTFDSKAETSDDSGEE